MTPKCSYMLIMHDMGLLLASVWSSRVRYGDVDDCSRFECTLGEYNGRKSSAAVSGPLVVLNGLNSYYFCFLGRNSVN